MVEKYGHLVRLRGVDPSQLPSATASGQELVPLLTSILLEAYPFVEDISSSPSSPWKRKGSKKFANSTAPVELYERVVSAQELEAVAKDHKLPQQQQQQKPGSETWVLRKSVHENAAVTGTARWDEFQRSFKEEHAKTEQEFTPTVISHRLEREWDCGGAEIKLGGDVWEDWTLKQEESVHKMPAPLKNRLFPVLQATASVRGRRDFLVVQIALREPEAGGGKNSSQDLVRGAYTSVERVRETRDGVEWIMGTVSDAKGVLPGWVQKMAVPGAVAKDVDMFLEWAAKERKRKGGEGKGILADTSDTTRAASDVVKNEANEARDQGEV